MTTSKPRENVQLNEFSKVLNWFLKANLTVNASLTAQLTFICSKSPIETLEEGVTYVQSKNFF